MRLNINKKIQTLHYQVEPNYKLTIENENQDLREGLHNKIKNSQSRGANWSAT